MSSLLETSVQKEFLKKLLKWYRTQGRHDMPWRKTDDPYAIFVSEFMLQQTTVGTVRPYYDRFLSRFPTIKSLAKADLNDVLALWSGLGYYARARNLWAAMKMVIEDYHGKIPHQVDELLKLPGVGFYTAGAISTLAYNKPAAVLDGNIIRVMMRLLALEDDPKLKAIQVLLRRTMIDMMIHSRKTAVRDVVLALMDLGATLCAPQNPKCLICPVSEFCLAQKNGRQENIPFKDAKIARPTVRRLHAVLTHKGQWLMGQRSKEGLFGGLWEFPGLDSPGGADPIRLIEETLKDELKLRVQVTESLSAFEHQLSHKIMVNRPYVCKTRRDFKIGKLVKAGMEYDQFRWVYPKHISRYGISSITRRIINQLTLRPSPFIP